MSSDLDDLDSIITEEDPMIWWHRLSSKERRSSMERAHKTKKKKKYKKKKYKKKHKHKKSSRKDTDWNPTVKNSISISVGKDVVVKLGSDGVIHHSLVKGRDVELKNDYAFHLPSKEKDKNDEMEVDFLSTGLERIGSGSQSPDDKLLNSTSDQGVKTETLDTNIKTLDTFNDDRVYGWENYPYCPNEAGDQFYVRKPTDDESNSFSLKWGYVFCTYSRDKDGMKWIRKQCLGCYQCSAPGCVFVATPTAPKKKSATALPTECKYRCPQHKTFSMHHVQCGARLKVCDMVAEGLFCVNIVDNHSSHRLPPQKSGMIPYGVRQGIQRKVQENPGVLPRSLIVGGAHRSPLCKDFPEHPGVSNRDGIRRLMMSFKKTEGSNVWSQLVKICNETEMIVSHSIIESNFHITFQDESAVEAIAKTTTSFQSDAVEGFFRPTETPWDATRTAAVEITSCYDPLSQHYRPCLITLLGGKTATHYKEHFYAWFTSCPTFASYEAFVEWFPGNTSDFSMAQANGFFSAAIEFFSNKYSVIKSREELERDLNLKYCTVHFKRTLGRVSRNSRFVPASKEKEFVKLVLELLEFQNGQFQQFFLHFKRLFDEYTNAGEWLKWHLQPGIATILFPACKEFPSDEHFSAWKESVSDNTNASENMGKQYQELSEKKQMNLFQIMSRTRVFLESFAHDHELSQKGTPIRHGINLKSAFQQPKKRRAKKGDADESEHDPSKKVGKPKRRRNSRKFYPNRAAASEAGRAPDTNEWASSNANEGLWLASIPSIPFGMLPSEENFPAMTLTCPLDTALTCIYIMWKEEYLHDQDKLNLRLPQVVKEAFTLLGEKEYDKVRRHLYWAIPGLLPVPNGIESNRLVQSNRVEDIYNPKRSTTLTGLDDITNTFNRLLGTNPTTSNHCLVAVSFSRLATHPFEQSIEEAMRSRDTNIGSSPFLILGSENLETGLPRLTFNQFPRSFSLPSAKDQVMDLRCVIFLNNQHYSCCILSPFTLKWLFYDGLGAVRVQNTKNPYMDLSPSPSDTSAYLSWITKYSDRKIECILYEVSHISSLPKKAHKQQGLDQMSEDIVTGNPNDKSLLTCDPTNIHTMYAAAKDELRERKKLSAKISHGVFPPGVTLGNRLPSRRKCRGCGCFMKPGTKYVVSVATEKKDRSHPIFCHASVQCLVKLPQPKLEEMINSTFGNTELMHLVSTVASELDRQKLEENEVTASGSTSASSCPPSVSLLSSTGAVSEKSNSIPTEQGDSTIFSVSSELSSDHINSEEMGTSSLIDYHFNKRATEEVADKTIVSTTNLGNEKKHDGKVITLRQFQTLRPRTWLNDDIINFFMDLLRKKSQPSLEFGFYNTYLVSALMIGSSSAGSRNITINNDALKAATLKTKSRLCGKRLFDHEKLLIPVNIDNTHWILTVVLLKARKIVCLDSMGGKHRIYMKAIQMYLTYESNLASKTEGMCSTSDWEILYPGCPQQENGYDCGVFVCMFAHYLANGWDLSFTQEMIPQSRRFIASCLLKKHIPNNDSDDEEEGIE